MSVLPPVLAWETIQAWPDRPSRSYPVGVTVGPTSRVSHPSLAARGANFNTDYLSQLCRCGRRASRPGRPSKPGPSCLIATNHLTHILLVQLRLPGPPTRRVRHPSLATRAADFDTGHPAQLCPGPSGRQCRPGKPSKPAPTDHHTHILFSRINSERGLSALRAG